jgi:hypothetical protein
MAVVVLGCSHFEHCSITALHAARSSRCVTPGRLSRRWRPRGGGHWAGTAASGAFIAAPSESRRWKGDKVFTFHMIILLFASTIHHLRIMAPRRVGKAHHAARQVAMQPVHQL